MADEFDLEKLLPYILNTVPGYDAVKNRHELAALGEAITSPIKAHVEQEQARQAAKQLMGEHAAANLGIDPEGGLPAAGRAPIAAPPTAQVPDVPPAAPPATVLPPFQVVGGRGAAAPAGGAPAPDPTGPYAQSPSMLPGTDPEEIAAAKRAADKQAAAAKFAAEEQEVRDAQAAGKKAGEMPWWQKLLTAAADPETQEIVRKRQETAQNKPLQELMQRRELLAKMREEKSKLSEQERQESLNDPDSELTKTSALALRSLGVAPPKGYTAAMYEQMKGIAQLAGAQKNDAAKLIVDQHREAETERQNRAQNAIERERIAAAEGNTSRAARDKAQVTAEATDDARKEADDAAAEYKRLAAISGNSPLFGSAAAQEEQALHKLAEAKVKLNAARTGAPPRPNAVEEERKLLPKVGPAALLKDTGTSVEEVDSYLKGMGGHPAGPAAPAPVGGGWDATKEARLQELRRKAAAGK